MPSNKKTIHNAGGSIRRVKKPVDFSKVIQSTQKTKVKPVDRGMVFVSYLLEQEISRQQKNRSAGSTKSKLQD